MGPAVFFDDGALARDALDDTDPTSTQLRNGAGRVLSRLQRCGYALVLVTNQPRIAHGLITETELERAWERLHMQLVSHGVVLDAIYCCPHDPDGVDQRYALKCACHKPQPGLLFRAAARYSFDLLQSWSIGPSPDDIEAGHRAGCRTVLLADRVHTGASQNPLRIPDFVAPDLAAAAEVIVSEPGVPEHQGAA